jgi:hypothetical protein
MGCICDKEVLFFGEESRDTSHSVYLYDLTGLKNQQFCLFENDRKGKNGLKRVQCSETLLIGESRFHISPPRGFEHRSLVAESKGLVHWTSETW